MALCKVQLIVPYNHCCSTLYVWHLVQTYNKKNFAKINS